MQINLENAITVKAGEQKISWNFPETNSCFNKNIIYRAATLSKI